MQFVHANLRAEQNVLRSVVFCCRASIPFVRMDFKLHSDGHTYDWSVVTHA